jgi:hypothetical protein
LAVIPEKVFLAVIPAKAGIQDFKSFLDARLQSAGMTAWAKSAM